MPADEDSFDLDSVSVVSNYLGHGEIFIEATNKINLCGLEASYSTREELARIPRNRWNDLYKEVLGEDPEIKQPA